MTWDRAGNCTRDTTDRAGNHVRNTWDKAGNITRDTTDRAGDHIHETWDRAGNCTRDTTDRAGNHVHDTWDKAGNVTRDTRDRAGNHTSERWDKAGDYLCERWDKTGDYQRDVWDGRRRHLSHVGYAAGEHINPEPMGGGAHMPSAGAGRIGGPVSTAGAGNPAPEGKGGATAGDGGSAPVGTAAEMRMAGATGGGQTDAPERAVAGAGSDSSQPANGYQTGNPTGNVAPDKVDGGAVNVTGQVQPAGGRVNYSAETSSHSSAIEPVLAGFDAAHQGILHNVWQHAKRMVDSTLDKLLTRGPDANFARWFGSPTPADVDHVKQVLSNIQHSLAHDRYTLFANPMAPTDEIAHVNPGIPRQIDLASLVFKHWYGPDTAETTLIHELSHFNNIGATGDHAYGPEDDHLLAVINSQVAVTNADNYASYVESSNRDA